MLDRANFMETLRSVAEIAKTSNQPLSREEIQKYFENMELSTEQQEMVYQYLLNPQTEEESVEDQPTQEEVEEQAVQPTEEESSEQLSESALFKMYIEDIHDLPILNTEQMESLYDRLLQGDESVIQSISDHWLKEVLEIAKTYAQHNVTMEDVVQEGNMGLIFGLSSLLNTKERIDMEGYLRQSIKESIESYIDEMMNEEDWGSTVIAKVTLIHEAQKALTEQLDRTPTKAELTNYTNLPEEEITDILDLIKSSSKR